MLNISLFHISQKSTKYILIGPFSQKYLSQLLIYFVDCYGLPTKYQIGWTPFITCQWKTYYLNTEELRWTVFAIQWNNISVVPALLTLPNFFSLSLSPMQEFGYRWPFAYTRKSASYPVHVGTESLFSFPVKQACKIGRSVAISKIWKHHSQWKVLRYTIPSKDCY